MSAQTKRVLWRFLLYALFGLLMEVFFGACGKLARHDWNMRGGTSPWMMLDYGILGLVVGPIGDALKHKRIPLPGRAVVYMLGIYFVELVSGWLFDLIGVKVWDYSHLKYNLHGYITLMYAPFWFGLGLVVEPIYRKIDIMAAALSLGLSADQIAERNRPTP